MTEVTRATLGITHGEDIEDIEDNIALVFGVNCERSSRPLETVGDLYDFISQELADAPRGQACQTLMAFNRVRSALLAYSPRADIRPSTSLHSFGRPASKLFRFIARSAKVELPFHVPTWVGVLGYVCIVAGAVGLIVGPFTAAHDLWLSLALPIGIWLIWQDAGRFPENCTTVGDLARATAKLNVTRLAAGGGRLDADDIWSALVEIVEASASEKTGRIGRETRFA